MEKPLRALILEDSHSDTLLLLRELRQAGYQVEHTRVDTAEAMIAALKNTSWDIILSDFSMPQFSATAALNLVQAQGLDIPFIIVSGTMGEEAAVAAMKAGAHDYFAKGRTGLLGVAIEREVREAQERVQRKLAEEELRLSEERFTKAFQVSPIGITINDPRGHFLIVNDAFRQMLSLQSDEIVGRTVKALDFWTNPDDHTLLTGEVVPTRDTHLVLRTQSGAVRHVSIFTEPIDLGGEVCMLAMWQDVTERKQAEAALQKNMQLIQLLQATTVAANEALEISSALQTTLDHICQFAGWSLGHIYLPSKGNDPQLTSSRIWYSADPGRFASFQRTAEQLQFSRETGGFVYRVFTTGMPEQLFDLSVQAGFFRAEEAKQTGIQAAYAFPILVQHEVVAVMEFFALTAAEPDQELFDTIPHIATQVGHVIERVRANEEIQALYDATAYLFNADTVNDLAQQIVHAVVNEFEQVDCELLWIDLPTGQVHRLARAGGYRGVIPSTLTLDGFGLIPRAIRENQIVYARDVEQETDYLPSLPETRSEIVVPLRTRDRVIGALDLQSNQRDYFNQRDERILSAFAERAAAALEIIQLYEEINRHAAQLEVRVEERTQELQTAKERVEAILNNSSDAIILLNMNGIIQQTNPRVAEIFGYDYDELFGEELAKIITLNDEQSLILQEVFASRSYQRSDVLVRRKDGTVFPADAAFAAFSRNHHTEIVCSLRDISKQKQLEHELRAAFEQQRELTNLKTRFISMVSHEYRTPLTVITMAAETLQVYHERLSEEDKNKRLEKIQIQVKHLTNLLDDVLEISRTETITKEIRLVAIDIADLCREIITDFQQINPHHGLELHLVGETIPIMADAQLIRQIITNLISNAIKYSPNQGKVEVQVSFEADMLILRIRDEGIGIPDTELDKLFTVFHRARNVGQIQGTGLGLAIVKQAVNAHGGTIAVESIVGQGTTFTVRLPYL